MQTVSDKPIVISRPDSAEVDIGLVIDNAHEEVEKVLPEAYLGFFSFVGDCDGLTTFRGQVNLNFIKSEKALFWEHIYVAEVHVDTVRQTLSFKISDEASHYPSLESLLLDQEQIIKAANSLYTYLEATNQCHDNFVLQRGATTEPWGVRCGFPEQALTECLKIDPVTGEITTEGVK